MDSANKSLFGLTGLAPVDSWYSFPFHAGAYTQAAFTRAYKEGDNYYISRLNDTSRLNPNVSYFIRLNKEGHWDNVFTITNGGFGSAFHRKIGTKIYCATTNTFSVLNEDLSVVWSKSFSSYNEFRIADVEIDSNGTIYIVARYWYATSEFATAVICLNSSGTLQWCKRFRIANKNVTPTAIKVSSTTGTTLCLTFNRDNIYFFGTNTAAFAATMQSSDGSLIRQGFFDSTGSYYYYANDLEFDGTKAYIAGYVVPQAGGNKKAWVTEFDIGNSFQIYSSNSNTLEQSGVDLYFNGIKRTTGYYKCVGSDAIVEYQNNASVPTSQYKIDVFGINLSKVVEYSGGTYVGDRSKDIFVAKNIDGLSRPRTWSNISLSTTTRTDGGPSDFFTDSGAGISTFEDFSSITINNHTPTINQLTNQLSEGAFVSNASNSY